MKKREKKIYRMDTDSWHMDRKIYAIAGFLVIVSVLLGLYQDENWLYFTLLVGAMLINFSLTGYCPMAIILDRWSSDGNRDD